MISVIIPIYGVEKYIERCARSILGQTYGDVEYIFVNDCTKDNSMQILNNVIKEYPQSNTIIVNKENNEGLPQARRTGLLASHGDYIIHFDSDDWVEEACLLEMFKVAQKNDADVVIADYFENYSDKEVRISCRHFDNPKIGIDMLLRAQHHSGVWNKLVKRELYDGVIFPQSNMHEDLVTMIQIFANAKKICFINSAFYHYNQTNMSSMTNDFHSYMKSKGAYDNLKMIETFLINQEIMEIHEAAFSNFANTFKVAILLRLDTRKKEWIDTLYPQSKRYLFSENRQSFVKTVLLWLAIHNCYWPCKLIDFFHAILKK